MFTRRACLPVLTALPLGLALAVVALPPASANDAASPQPTVCLAADEAPPQLAVCFEDQEAEDAEDKLVVPGLVRLLPGYTHQPMQGIDSIVGRIVGENGVEISYEIGHVTPPGAPALGGSFSNRAQHAAQHRDAVASYQQTLGQHTAHVTLHEGGKLFVSYPTTGANFVTDVDGDAELTEALLIILTHATHAEMDEE